jgi:formylglycine-generating enzyme required for sulfatase activity
MSAWRPTLDARSIHRVYVDGFYMGKTDVTNAQFAEFVLVHQPGLFAIHLSQ